jgi:hypothetical protein
MPGPWVGTSGVSAGRPYAFPPTWEIAYILFQGTVFPAGGSNYRADTIGKFGPQIAAAQWDSSDHNGTGQFNSYLTYYLYGTDQPPVNPFVGSAGFTPWIKWTAVNSRYDVDPQGDDGLTSAAFHNYSDSGGFDVWVGSASIWLYGDIAANMKDTLAHHELGHTLALNDCYTCTVGSTVMYGYSASTPTFYSACDMQQTRQTAYPF